MQIFIRAAMSTLFSVILLSSAVAQTISVGDIGIAANAPFYIGIEKGYFAEEGLKVVLERLNSGAQGTALLSTNQLQVLEAGVNAGLFNALAKNWPIKVVLTNTRQLPGYNSNALIVREDLKDKVKTLKDLKGLRVAVNAPAAVLHYMVGQMLASADLKMSDIDLVIMPWPNVGPALQSKAIDASAITEPYATQYADQHLSFTLKTASDVIRGPFLETSVVLFNSDWAKQNPSQATGFATAYLKGARDYYDAMKGGKKRSEVIEILAKYTSLKDKELYNKINWSYMDPNGDIRLNNLENQQDWYAEQGALPKKVDIASYIDYSYRDEALKKIGRLEVSGAEK